MPPSGRVKLGRDSQLIDLDLDRSGALPLNEQLYKGIKGLILAGVLRSGARLPASRILARELEISRNTVLAAYDQLLAEGFTEARPGAGTRVSADLPDLSGDLRAAGPLPADAAAPPPLPARVLDLTSRHTPGPGVLRPFLPGLPDVAAFPFDEWGRAVGRFWRRPPLALLEDRDGRGHGPLRRAIADYLVAVRGAKCTADQVIITSGAQQGIDLCVRVLLEPGAPVVMENPGYRGLISAFSSAGAKVVQAPVDGEGLDVAQARRLAPHPRLLAVTPSHQFPLGSTMSLARRLDLLAWARDAGFWILEDDYDSEYRYRGRPLAALQGLDGGDRVIYVGTFSKVMFPALRLGYLVVPEPLVDAFVRLRGAVDDFPALAMQPVLADFMESGRFGAHVRRMRQVYGERQAVLRDELTARFDGLFDVPDDDAGMHLTVTLAPGGPGGSLADGAIAREAAALDITARALSGYYDGPKRRHGLVLGYTAYPADALKRAAALLEQAVGRALAGA
ncbi:MAG: PLP-dependent aminotransferase family protein [Rhodospirillales bacterium]